MGTAENAMTTIRTAARELSRSSNAIMLGMPGMPAPEGPPASKSSAAPALPSRPRAAVAGALAGLRYAEVETSRFCNRTCQWCPNGHSGARRAQQLMSWPLFAKVTAELADAGFAGFIALHNYNEPLANPRLYAELDRLRTVAPWARPAIYTNGDLLKRDVLERLLAAGVKYVRVTRYPHRANVPPTAGALRRWLAQAGLGDAFDWRYDPVRQGLAARWEDEATGVAVEVIRPSIMTYNDRGGTALVPGDPQARVAPCRMTETSASVDYRGWSRCAAT